MTNSATLLVEPQPFQITASLPTMGFGRSICFTVVFRHENSKFVGTDKSSRHGESREETAVSPAGVPIARGPGSVSFSSDTTRTGSNRRGRVGGSSSSSSSGREGKGGMGVFKSSGTGRGTCRIHAHVSAMSRLNCATASLRLRRCFFADGFGGKNTSSKSGSSSTSPK
jgi:hypothetical protein